MTHKSKLTLALTACVALVGLVACNTVADFLESPVNAAVLDVASAEGAAQVSAALGDKVTDDQKAIIVNAAKAGIKTTSTGAVYWFAEWLRTLQSTKHDVNTDHIATQIPNPVIASAPAALNAIGVPADVANEAIAATLQSVADQKTKSTSPGK